MAGLPGEANIHGGTIKGGVAGRVRGTQGGAAFEMYGYIGSFVIEDRAFLEDGWWRTLSALEGLEPEQALPLVEKMKKAKTLRTALETSCELQLAKNMNEIYPEWYAQKRGLSKVCSVLDEQQAKSEVKIEKQFTIPKINGMNVVDCVLVRKCLPKLYAAYDVLADGEIPRPAQKRIARKLRER